MLEERVEPRNERRSVAFPRREENRTDAVHTLRVRHLTLDQARRQVGVLQRRSRRLCHVELPERRHARPRASRASRPAHRSTRCRPPPPSPTPTCRDARPTPTRRLPLPLHLSQQANCIRDPYDALDLASPSVSAATGSIPSRHMYTSRTASSRSPTTASHKSLPSSRTRTRSSTVGVCSLSRSTCSRYATPS